MILLVSVNNKKNYSTISEYSAIQPNLYLWLLASVLRSLGNEVKVIDAEAERIGHVDLLSRIHSINPDLVGIVCSGSNPSASTMSMIGAIEFMSLYRHIGLKPKVFIWGGHPSVLPERTLQETKVDYVVVGEGYREIPNLSRITHTKDLYDVNLIPSVDWDEINPSKYQAHNWHCFGELDKRTPYGVIWTSLGCPYGCEFCCINNLFGKRTYRTRDMNKVVAEIDKLVSLGVRQIKIMDELFITKHPRIDLFCDLLEQRKYDLNMWCFARVDTVDERILTRLKKVGVNWVAYGFESASERVLKGTSKGNNISKYDEVVKITRNSGMNIIADVIAGLWEDDYTSLSEMYEFLVKHNFEFINMYPAFAFPGTPIYKHSDDWKEYSLFGDTCKPLGTKYLSPSEVLKWRDEHYVKYLKRPEYLSMLESKFDKDTKAHVERMVATPLKRNAY